MSLDQISGRPTPLASLTKATSRIARARSMEDVVETIRQTARTLIGCEGISVIRREGDLCHYVEEDAIGPLWKGQRFPATSCISGWAMINRQTVVIPDIASDDRIPHALYAETFVRSVMMAPVRTNAPIGAIGAYWSQTYSPSQWEIETLEALAEAATTAIDNIGLFAFVLDKGDEHAADPDDSDLAEDVKAVAGIAVVPTILDVVLRMTGMGFAAIARVTDTRWITCQALDNVGFGLKAGDELPIEGTPGNEIQSYRRPIVFEDTAIDPHYAEHLTPQIYGLRSYISVPIMLNGTFWGTLCAIDSHPADVNDPQVLGSMTLFAELIARHLEAGQRHRLAHASLDQERELAELREQFIAILAHDLRNPLAAIDAGTSKLLREGWTERSPTILKLMKSSVSRMSALVDNVMDFAQARLGGGIILEHKDADLAETLQQVIDELRASHGDLDVVASFAFDRSVSADHLRLAQLLSNLLSNAMTHGDKDKSVRINGSVVSDELEISVSNTGQPISPAEIEKLFHPFRRGDQDNGVLGLGLGLYIASEIAKSHGGRIDVQSDESETRFTFRMPLAV